MPADSLSRSDSASVWYHAVHRKTPGKSCLLDQPSGVLSGAAPPQKRSGISRCDCLQAILTPRFTGCRLCGSRHAWPLVKVACRRLRGEWLRCGVRACL